MIQTLTTWKGISLNAESAITPIKTSAHWGSNVCRCFLQRWQYLDTTRVSVILWSVWNWLWKYGCMSPGLYFVSLNVMGFKLSWTRFPGLLHNTEGGHRTCSLPPPSQTHTHTHTSAERHAHTRPGHICALIRWYERELRKPLHLQTENKNTLSVYSQVGRSLESDF